MSTPSLKLGLPKWPALLVSGAKVTPDQAIEINFRTASDYWSTNDREFLAFIADTIGTDLTEYGSLNFSREISQKWGHISLSYLSNSNIVSSYIGGPHGWCSWDGTIFSNSYNIGKWPSVDAVFEDWSRIAEAFPFLSLRSQLLDGETADDGVRNAVVEFVVADGKVNAFEPEDKTPMVTAAGLDMDYFARNFNNRYREHGTEQSFTERYERFKVLRGL